MFDSILRNTDGTAQVLCLNVLTGVWEYRPSGRIEPDYLTAKQVARLRGWARANGVHKAVAAVA